jgi:ABC-type methionine transport system permease subunit
MVFTNVVIVLIVQLIQFPGSLMVRAIDKQ